MAATQNMASFFGLKTRELLEKAVDLNQSSLEFPWPWPTPSSSGFLPLFNSSASDCGWQNHLKHNLEVTALVTAATIIVLLNLIQPRTKTQCQQRYTLWSVLDLVSPVRLLGATPFRYMYCIIMGCWGTDVIQNLFDKSLYYRSENGLLDALTFFVNSPTVIILKEALLYFPVLACVDAPVRLVGYIIGFFYTVLLGVYKVDIEAILIMGCSYYGQQNNKEIGVSLAVHVPVYLNYLVVAVWFFCHTMTELTLLVFTRSSMKHHTPVYREQTRYVNHVKCLLKKPERLLKLGRFMNADNLRAYLIRGFKFVLPYQSTFIYPLPFLAGMYMSFMIIYQLIVHVMYKEVMFANHLKDFIAGFNITVETIKEFLPHLSHKLDNFFYDANSFAEAYLIILPFGTAIAFGLCMFFVMYMTQSFHKDLHKAYRGDISALVKSEPLPSPTYRLVATMRFTAFLVSHIVFTWMLYSFMMVSLLCVGLMFYYLFKDARNFAIHFWSWFMIPMMWATMMHHLQLVLCRWVFKDQSGGQDLVKIRYKGIYDILTYIFFFFNVIFGVVMCFLRVFGVFMFTMVMLFRLDWDVYMRGLEGWDTGNRTYVGYIYTEVTYNNSVVRVFIQLLQDTVHQSRHQSRHLSLHHPRSRLNNHIERNNSSSNVSSSNEREPLLTNSSVPINYSDRNFNYSKPVTRESIRARNRWLVAYTLIRNPSIQDLTASRLKIECGSLGENDEGSVDNQLVSSVLVDDDFDV